MEANLLYVSDRGGVHARLTKTLKKAPPVLPDIGDGWTQAGWALVVDGRLWTENMDRVTIYLVPESSLGLRDLRQISRDLVEAGWSDEA